MRIGLPSLVERQLVGGQNYQKFHSTGSQNYFPKMNVLYKFSKMGSFVI